MPEPWGRHPVLLLARNEAYSLLHWLAAAPTTTTIRALPTTVLLTPEDDAVPVPCVVQLDHILQVDRQHLRRKITTLRSEKMDEVSEAIHFALDLA